MDESKATALLKIISLFVYLYFPCYLSTDNK